MRLLSSQLKGPGPIVTSSAVDRTGYHPEQRAAQAPIFWPRYIPGRGTKMVRIDPRHIPPGWTAIGAHVPSRPATCDEIRCPMYLGGWTEIVPPDGSETVPKAGLLSRDEAAQFTGYFGAASLPPEVIHHEPGTACPVIHKIVDPRIPPLFTVDGRPVLWNQFEDTVGGGLYRAARLQQEGN